VDGFRFDLGELLGLDLLQEIEAELKELNPKIVLIAEPWSFRGRLPEKISQTGYSLWSDRCRESLLSFVKGEGEIEKIRSLMMGKLDHENIFPWQSIHYTESHDDYAFIDRICSDRADGGMIPSEEAVKQAQLAMFILFLSPGIPMISAGQDFLRSKKGIRNTYQHETVNALDYNRFSIFEGFSNEIRELIKFRLSPRGLFSRPGNFDDCLYKNIRTTEGEILGVAIQHKSSKEEFLILCNPTSKKISITLPDQWQVHEIIFPLESQSLHFSFLEPFGYRLLAKKI
jgi:pullulanase/glycogen debranching enzyme